MTGRGHSYQYRLGRQRTENMKVCRRKWWCTDTVEEQPAAKTHQELQAQGSLRIQEDGAPDPRDVQDCKGSYKFSTVLGSELFLSTETSLVQYSDTVREAEAP